MSFKISPLGSKDLPLAPPLKKLLGSSSRFAGGNGINAGRIAHRLGAPVIVSGFLGGSIGAEVRRLLESENVNHNFITKSGNTRINLTVSNKKTNLGIHTIVDMPVRALREVILSRPLLIKPNLHEFQELTAKRIKSISAVVASAKKLTEKVKLVCVSSVEGGAVLVRKNRAWFGQIPKVKIRSTVGAGDSMVGSMARTLHSLELHKVEPNKLNSIRELI